MCFDVDFFVIHMMPEHYGYTAQSDQLPVVKCVQCMAPLFSLKLRKVQGTHLQFSSGAVQFQLLF